MTPRAAMRRTRDVTRRCSVLRGGFVQAAVL